MHQRALNLFLWIKISLIIDSRLSDDRFVDEKKKIDVLYTAGSVSCGHTSD